MVLCWIFSSWHTPFMKSFAQSQVAWSSWSLCSAEQSRSIICHALQSVFLPSIRQESVSQQHDIVATGDSLLSLAPRTCSYWILPCFFRQFIQLVKAILNSNPVLKILMRLFFLQWVDNRFFPQNWVGETVFWLLSPLAFGKWKWVKSIFRFFTGPALSMLSFIGVSKNPKMSP